MPASSVRAVLFDFDGTLADSYAAIAASVNHVRAAFDLPPMSLDEVRRLVGHGLNRLMETTITVPGADLAKAATLYREHHPTVMGPMTRLLPGATEAMRALTAGGVRLGVCSNKPVAFTGELLYQLGVGELFQVVVGPEDVAAPKPAPDMLLEALRRLDVATTEALYVGDMRVDIETGRAAGVRVWAVATGSVDRDALTAAGPDRLLDSLAEIPALLGL